MMPFLVFNNISIRFIINIYNLYKVYTVLLVYEKKKKKKIGGWNALIMDFLSQCGIRLYSYLVFRGHTPYSLAS